MTVIYKPSEVMKKFNIKESLYKKYIAAIEKEGYLFQKNQQGHRIFSDKDIEILENFLELIKYDGMTIEIVARKIATMYSHDVTPEVEVESYDVISLVDKAVTAALETQEKLLMAKFHEKFQETQAQLDRIESRANERDKILITSIRESQEIKKILLEVKEQTAASKEDPKVSWWKKLFSKQR